MTTKERIRALYDPETQTYAPEAMSMAKAIGNAVAKMHDADIVHGDLTTSNMMLRTPEFHESAGVVMIDFGLGFLSNLHEGPDRRRRRRVLILLHSGRFQRPADEHPHITTHYHVTTHSTTRVTTHITTRVHHPPPQIRPLTCT